MINRRGFLGAAVAAPVAAPDAVKAMQHEIMTQGNIPFNTFGPSSGVDAFGPIEDPNYIDELRRTARGQGWFPDYHESERNAYQRMHYESLRSMSPAVRAVLLNDKQMKEERARRISDAIKTLVKRGLSW